MVKMIGVKKRSSAITDITEELGLSVDTVAMALCGPPVVMEATRKRVVPASRLSAQPAGTQPALPKKQLRQLDRSGIAESCFVEKVDASREVLREAGLGLTFACTGCKE